MDNCGYLEIILGPMFAGKTSKLIEIYNKNIITLNNFLKYHEFKIWKYTRKVKEKQ